ncbi:MAG: lipoyl(octanoyl) transferase LipB [Gammaproteobacteria bacterium]
MTATIKHLGLQPYEKTWRDMQTFTRTRKQNQTDEFWFVEHPPVFTLGQAGKPEHILNAHDISIVNTDRGGQVTYHGPGQLICYTLIDLKRIKWNIRKLVCELENSVIECLKHYDLSATGHRDRPGVYINNKKIASIGLRVKRGYSYHGISFNVDMDLTPFSYINPCGYEDLAVTQVKNLAPEASKLDILRLWEKEIIKRYCS